MDIKILKEIAEESFKSISGSATFLGICGKQYVKDPVCLIQFALGIFLDRPLFLLIGKGTKPPKRLIRLLDGYEFYEEGDEDSFREAGARLLSKVQRYLQKEDDDEDE